MDPTFAYIIGPMLVIVCFALILYGTFTTQVYYYWNEYKMDSAYLRCYVYLIWVFETVHTTCCIVMLYYYFITNFGDRDIADQIFWSIFATVLLEITIVGLCQAFYIYRIWRFSNRSFHVIAAPALLLSLRLALGYAACSHTLEYARWSEYTTRKGIVPLLNTAFVCGVLVDIITTSLLTYFLMSRREGLISQTKHIVDHLMFYTLNTGGITIVFSLTILFTYNFMSESLLWMGMVEAVSKVYANAMLVMLNARKSLRIRSDPEHSAPIPLSIWSGGGETHRSHNDGVRIDVFKETITEQHAKDSDEQIANETPENASKATFYTLP